VIEAGKPHQADWDGEIAILAALADAPPRTSAELAEETGLLPVAVRFILRKLAQRGLVWRPVSGYAAGRWQLTTEALPDAVQHTGRGVV